MLWVLIFTILFLLHAGLIKVVNLSVSFKCILFFLHLQSQVYRSQSDLVSAVYDTTSSTLAVDYSYGQYPAQNDVSQNYYGYPEYTADSTWTAPEQRKMKRRRNRMHRRRAELKPFELSLYTFLTLLFGCAFFQLPLVLRPRRSSPCPTVVPVLDLVVTWSRFCPISLRLGSLPLLISTAWKYVCNWLHFFIFYLSICLYLLHYFNHRLGIILDFSCVMIKNGEQNTKMMVLGLDTTFLAMFLFLSITVDT